MKYCEDCENIILGGGWGDDKSKELEFSRCSKSIDNSSPIGGLHFVSSCFAPPDPDYNYCSFVRLSKGGGDCENFKPKEDVKL